MKQVLPVSGDNPQEFADAYNEACCELSRFTIERVVDISPTNVLIHYETHEEDLEKELREILNEALSDADYDIDIPDDEDDGPTQTVRVNLNVAQPGDRKCCECENLDWGRGCQYRSGHVRPMDPACIMFNIEIGRR